MADSAVVRVPDQQFVLGEDGATFTPAVSSDGTLSWTNDRGKENPEPVNIKGPQGDKLTYADLTAADKADLIQGPIAEAQTAAVAAVNQAGTGQVAAVQQKGDEVLASIPEDYAELTEDVDDLKSALNYVENTLVCAKTKLLKSSISSIGEIETSSNRELVCYQVKAGEVISAVGEFDLYGFFENKPGEVSQTYNNSRTLSNTLNNVIVPSGCKWIAIRQIMGNNDVVILPNSEAYKFTCVVSKTGNGDYTKLVDAIENAEKTMNSVIYVMDGTYDILSELGQTYLDNVSSTQRGIVLKNNVTIICGGDVLITADYTGSNDNVKSLFSIFNAGVHGFTLVGATIKGSNIRYLIHDERSTYTDSYRNNYINCNMYMDNSENYAWTSSNCIGGGLGVNGFITIDGCVFESTKNPAQNINRPVSYHNSSSANAKSIIFIKNCIAVGEDSYFSFGYYGTAPANDPTIVVITGCRFGRKPVLKPETVDSTIVNMKIMAFNNEIVSEQNYIFSNPEVGKFIKEFYQEGTVDLSTVTKIRIFNNFSGYYGFRMMDASNNIIVDFYNIKESNGLVFKENSVGRAYAVFDDLTTLGASYKDFQTSVNDCVKSATNMPVIYAYLQSVGDFYPFNSHEVNKFIPEYYQSDDTDLSGVTHVRIYNGYSGLYGFKLYDSNLSTVVDCTFNSAKDGIVEKSGTYALLENLSSLDAAYKDFKMISVNSSVKNVETMPTIYAYLSARAFGAISAVSLVPTVGQIIYEGDTKSNSGYIVNAVTYPDGVIIACRADGTVVRIGYSGTEETLLTISGTAPFDWRGCYMDSVGNVYVSPHASYGSMSASDRGLYRLTKGGSSFTKVLALYDSGSSVPTEAENNDDTIWTMCEDDDGNLYAGVYAHTVRANPAIYKSTDGGATWTYAYNFKTAGDTPTGKHIHSIVWSKWQKALYVIVGEVNTIFKSTDGGTTWTNLHVTLTVKGSSMLPTEFGIFVGSDGAYNCEIDILDNDDKTHRNVFSGWANTVFAIRRSDLTGMLYAFTKIDSSVNSTSYFPPVGALTDPDVIDTWHTSVGDTVYNAWKAYHDSVVDTYPDDAIRPQHFSILVSRDGGNHWEPLKRFESSSEQANGFWTTGYFSNGECLAGRMVTRQMVKPIVISEGKHKYVSGGCDLSGEIFVRTNTSSTVEII